MSPVTADWSSSLLGVAVPGNEEALSAATRLMMGIDSAEQSEPDQPQYSARLICPAVSVLQNRQIQKRKQGVILLYLLVQVTGVEQL